MTIAIDFDGTCVKHEYPKVGAEIGSIPVLRKLVERGHQLILFTMRCDSGLEDAVQWFKNNGIPLYGIQYNPTQGGWTKSNKCYAQLYIDDAALGCPLTVPKNGSRSYVNWKKVENLLIKQGIL